MTFFASHSCLVIASKTSCFLQPKCPTQLPHGLCSQRLCFETLSPHSFLIAPFIRKQPSRVVTVTLTWGWSFLRVSSPKFSVSQVHVTYRPKLSNPFFPHAMYEARLNTIIIIATTAVVITWQALSTLHTQVHSMLTKTPMRWVLSSMSQMVKLRHRSWLVNEEAKM